MIRNANLGQMLELASAITRNLPKHIDEETAKAWIANPAALQRAIHGVLLKGELSRVTGLAFDGPNSFVTGGRSRELTNEGGWTFDVRVINDNQGVEFKITRVGGGEYWNLTTAAPKGCVMLLGHYDNAVRYPFSDDNPGLCFSGCHRGNNSLTGSFEVLEVQIEDHVLVSFAADFTQFDEGQAAKKVSGSIRYNSAIPIASK